MEARALNASDIHLTVGAPTVVRVNGELRKFGELSDMVVNRTILSILSADQEKLLTEGNDIDFSFELENGARQRVNVFRQSGRLACCIRLLNNKIPTLEELKMPPVLTELAQKRRGLILVTGPTGSGKSTTLYAALGEISKPNNNVITVEDPVEKKIDGVNQCQINEKAGMTFGAALRSILRQDPDIVMVGEMRDTETAEIAIRAAITGHLVLSTLHTNDAASTVTRLVDMGVEAYMVATSLIGIVAQRLTKVLCPECKKPRMSTEEENELMGLDHSVQVYDPCGCPKCNNTGYKGRTAIHEILLATPSMQALITRGAKADEIQELAKKEGCHLLRDNVSELVQQGKTSMDELIRVTYAV